jgi:hypothetical protein
MYTNPTQKFYARMPYFTQILLPAFNTQHRLNAVISQVTLRYKIIIFLSWQSVLYVEEPGENNQPAASHWQTLSYKCCFKGKRECVC